MKKVLALLLMLLLPVLAFAEIGPSGEVLPDAPLWQATMRIDTRIRTVKNMNSKDWLSKIPEETLVDIYAVDGDWCICKYNGDVGYIPHDRLYQFYCLADEPRPGSTVIEGIATLTEEMFLTVDGYSGHTFSPGTRMCSRKLGIVPMMRYHVQLAASAYTFEPFVKRDEAEQGDILYGFTTFYNESLGGRYPENRDFNISLAVERLQGITIQPGERFSFNQYCGPYTKKNGYKMAKNVSKDGYGYGGGVCQVSTTIFNALHGIEHTIEEWQLHSYNGVKYVPRNLDAAVSSTRDFSFINDESFPVEMIVKAENGVLTVLFCKGAEAASGETEPLAENQAE